jgi:8-oxo-dGTP pyrophosphatase MutT (NUDIX family)
MCVFGSWLGTEAQRANPVNGLGLQRSAQRLRRSVVTRTDARDANSTCLELPGGVIDHGETPLAAAKRELLEETGYSSTEWEFVGSMFANPARQTNRVHTFIARNIKAGRAQQLDASEEIECSLRPLAAVQVAIESGEFSQALHIASYYRCVQRAGDFGGA